MVRYHNCFERTPAIGVFNTPRIVLVPYKQIHSILRYERASAIAIEHRALCGM